MNKVTRTALLLVLVAAIGPAAFGISNVTPAGFIRTPEFWIATSANVAGIGLFVSRVHAPETASVFGYVTEAIGIPSLIFGVVDLAAGRADVATIGMLSYAGWALGAALVDHVLKIEYREPRNLGVLIPYVVFYYAGIGIASATQLVNGTTPWIIAGVTCVLTVASSFYARAKGAD